MENQGSNTSYISRSGYYTSSNRKYQLTDTALTDREKLDVDINLHRHAHSYVCKDLIGQGGLGSVYKLCSIDDSTRTIALKKDSQEWHSFLRTYAWELMANQYIVPMIFHFESLGSGYVGMTYYVRGDLFNHLNSGNRQNRVQARRWMYSIAFCHVLPDLPEIVSPWHQT